MTCNDTGYVAIEFDPQTHFPKITDVRIIIPHLFIINRIAWDVDCANQCAQVHALNMN